MGRGTSVLREREPWVGSSLPQVGLLRWTHPSPGHGAEWEKREISHLLPFMRGLFLIAIIYTISHLVKAAVS